MSTPKEIAEHQELEALEQALQPALKEHITALADTAAALWGGCVHFCVIAVLLEKTDGDGAPSAGVVVADTFNGDFNARKEVARALLLTARNQPSGIEMLEQIMKNAGDRPHAH